MGSSELKADISCTSSVLTTIRIFPTQSRAPLCKPGQRNKVQRVGGGGDGSVLHRSNRPE